MAHVGAMKCPLPACAGTAAISQSTTGNLSLRCPHCGFSGYAGPGSKAARIIDRATIKDEDEAPAPAAAPRPAAPSRPPAATPAPARKAAGLMIE